MFHHRNDTVVSKKNDVKCLKMMTVTAQLDNFKCTNCKNNHMEWLEFLSRQQTVLLLTWKEKRRVFAILWVVKVTHHIQLVICLC